MLDVSTEKQISSRIFLIFLSHSSSFTAVSLYFIIRYSESFDAIQSELVEIYRNKQGSEEMDYVFNVLFDPLKRF